MHADAGTGGVPVHRGVGAPAAPTQRTAESAPATGTQAERRVPGRELHRLIWRVRAWMVLPPVDALLLLLPALWLPVPVAAAAAFSAVGVLFITGGERFRARLHLSVLDDVPTLLSRLLMAAGAVATALALAAPASSAVTDFLTHAAVGTGLVLAGRILTTSVVSWSRRMRLTAHRTVLIGSGPVAADLASKLREQPRYGLSVVGLVDDGDDGVAERLVPRLGGLDDLDRIVRARRPDVLIVADGDFSEIDVLDAVRGSNAARCDVLVVPRLHHFQTQTGRADRISSIPIMRIRTPNLVGPGRWVKRAFDVLVAATGLIVLSPLLAAIAVAVRMEGPGVIFRQARVGKRGRTFDVLKFRSMRPADEHESATNWSIAGDDRVGRVGRFLRRTSLDEVPQLWNILRGDMSLVGPRPERPHFVERFSIEYERYSHRHRVVSGLTGMAQVSGLRGDTSIADRARYDNFYIENWSLWLDIKILLRTVSEVAFARGA
jgi:exopolysaccharide biosynthesis polyprenyl glycosylphosphotransferase